jgi:hypothetical protein
MMNATLTVKFYQTPQSGQTDTKSLGSKALELPIVDWITIALSRGTQRCSSSPTIQSIKK